MGTDQVIVQQPTVTLRQPKLPAASNPQDSWARPATKPSLGNVLAVTGLAAGGGAAVGATAGALIGWGSLVADAGRALHGQPAIRTLTGKGNLLAFAGLGAAIAGALTYTALTSSRTETRTLDGGYGVYGANGGYDWDPRERTDPATLTDGAQANQYTDFFASNPELADYLSTQGIGPDSTQRDVVARLTAKYDPDGDGKISVNPDALLEHPEDRRSALTALDDGVLTTDELARAVIRTTSLTGYDTVRVRLPESGSSREVDATVTINNVVPLTAERNLRRKLDRWTEAR